MPVYSVFADCNATNGLYVTVQSICDAVHCGAQSWCMGLKVVPLSSLRD